MMPMNDTYLNLLLSYIHVFVRRLFIMCMSFVLLFGFFDSIGNVSALAFCVTHKEEGLCI